MQLNSSRLSMSDLQPGRELDALVAEKVMSSCKLEGTFVQKIDTVSKIVTVGTEWQYPPYSTDISAAWDVVEKFKWAEPEVSYSDEQHCWYGLMNKGPGSGIAYGAPTAPHAICLAALKAVGYDYL